MTCEDVQLALSSEEPLSPPQQLHLDGCADCQAHRRDVERLFELARASTPSPPLPQEVAAFPARTWEAYQSHQAVVSGRRAELGRLALAACLGAGLASAMWALLVREAPLVAADVPALTRPALSSEDVLALEFPEVAWPDEAEGVVP